MKILLTILIFCFSFPAFAEEKESVFDRIMRTGELRCGYWNWAPLFTVDANTSVYGGIFYDVMNEFQRISGITVKWIHEVQYTNLVSDLESGKIDAVCAGVWPSAIRAKRIIFSDPVFFIPVEAYAKVGDTRFDHNLESANNPDVTIAVMDGEITEEIRHTDFPNSTVSSIPQISGSASELLVLIQNGKADLTFTDAVNGNIFMKGNPNSVRRVKTKFPVRTMPNTIAFNDDEIRLKIFVDDVLMELQLSGATERILKKYDVDYPGGIIRTFKPYEVSE